MSCSSAIRHLRCRRRSCAMVLRRVLVLVVALAVSSVPLPFVHRHALNGEQVASSPGLAQHIDRFHVRSFRASERETGWHLHLLSPWQAKEDAQHQSEAQPESVVPASIATDLSRDNGQLHALARLDALVLTLQVWTVSPLRTNVRATQFFSTYGCSVTICDLVSVRLC